MIYKHDLKPWGDLEIILEQKHNGGMYYYTFTLSNHMIDAAKYPRLITADCIREARQHIRKAIYDSRK